MCTSIHINAKLMFSTTVTAQGASTPPLAYLGGSSGGLDSSFAGALAEVRFWEVCRSQPELRRTLYTTLQGTEPGLFGYWLLVESPASVMHNSCALTGAALDGAAHNSSIQPISQSSDGAFLSMNVGLAGAPPFNASAFLRSSRWNHVAAVYEAGPAVAMNPNASFNADRLDYADCGSSNEFDVTTSLSDRCLGALLQSRHVSADHPVQVGCTARGTEFLVRCQCLGLALRPARY